MPLMTQDQAGRTRARRVHFLRSVKKSGSEAGMRSMPNPCSISWRPAGRPGREQRIRTLVPLPAIR